MSEQAPRWPSTPEGLQAIAAPYLPGLLGIEPVSIAHGEARLRLPVTQRHQAPNGYCHGGTVVTLADTACGYGTVNALPEGATGFTTVELKANFLGTVREGVLACTATLSHGGRTTQVWDAEVRDESNGRIIALFRCTQLLIYPRG